MRKFIFLLFLFVSSSIRFVMAQDFSFGSVSVLEATMTNYAPDTSANAVVLKEFGEAQISNADDHHLIFKYHVRIKILQKDGVDQGTIEIPLYRHDNNRYEKITSIKASSFNLENDRIREEAVAADGFFHEKLNKYYDLKKFAIPNVRVGTVIEVAYTLESPFIFNFRSWEFQSEIPKVHSEYWASIPGVYLYNITLRGFQQLSKNESKLVKDCLGRGDKNAGGYSADCAVMQFAMKDIPAFQEEEFMTAKKNFLSAIHFELSEIRYFDGRTDKVTKEWRDAEHELEKENRFGVQLRRGRDIAAEVEKLIAAELDDYKKAQAVYDFIKHWYLWNGTYGKYSELGIKKAFDERKGNVGDINLSLVAAMRFAGLDVEPVILSTRSNGLVVELHPVLSEFNYVIAKVNIGDKSYLADATEKFYPFGMLPERCLNGKGRVMGDKESYWIELKPVTTGKTVSLLNLRLENDGMMRGSLQTTYSGYEAVKKRQELSAFSSEEEYIKDLKNSLGAISVTGHKIRDLDEIEKPLIRILSIEIKAYDDLEAANFLFNPFITDGWKDNPFKSRERLYPVDFGVPIERINAFNLEFPAELEIINLPADVGLALPDAGGRFLFQARVLGNKLSVNNSLSINKTVYSSVEYHYLKELFNRILQIQNADLIFQKKG